jgi:hypothetical protein
MAGGSDSTIMAKQRLEGLRPAITGNKKLYSKDEYDFIAENKVRKYGANVGFCALLAHLGRAQVTKSTKCALGLLRK